MSGHQGEPSDSGGDGTPLVHFGLVGVDLAGYGHAADSSAAPEDEEEFEPEEDDDDEPIARASSGGWDETRRLADETAVDALTAETHLLRTHLTPNDARNVSSIPALARDSLQLLSEVGLHNQAATVRLALDRASAGLVTVVVAGETKRGKSALINALLGRPNLCPVDADVATNCYIEITEAPKPYVRVIRAGDKEPLSVDFDEISEWATMTGNPDNEKGVRCVQIGLSDASLHGLRLIDTPGVGGLTAAHAQLTLEVLREADALLFVIDVDAPLLAPELRFLERAADRIGSVIIALTKIDAERHWERLLETDRSLLQRHSVRLRDVPIVPVSSLLPEAATPDATGRSPAGAGVHDLAARLQTSVVQPAARIRLGALAWACREALGSAEGELAERLAATRPYGDLEKTPGDRERELRAEEEELIEFQDRVREELERIRLGRSRALRTEVEALRRKYFDRCTTLSKSARAKLPSELETDLMALERRLAHQSALQLDRALRQLLHMTETEHGLTERISPLQEDRTLPLEIAAPELAGLRDTDERLRLVSGFLLGSRIPGIVGQLLSAGKVAAAGSAVAGAPVVVAVGILWSVLTGRARSSHLDQSELRAWVQEQLALAGATLRDDFDERMITVKREIRRLVRRHVRDRRRELELLRRQYEQAAANDDDAVLRNHDRVQEQMRRVRACLERARALQATLVPSGVGSSAPHDD
jgi:GTP-binding protein EngB required for normal cell division